MIWDLYYKKANFMALVIKFAIMHLSLFYFYHFRTIRALVCLVVTH